MLTGDAEQRVLGVSGWW